MDHRQDPHIELNGCPRFSTDAISKFPEDESSCLGPPDEPRVRTIGPGRRLLATEDNVTAAFNYVIT